MHEFGERAQRFADLPAYLLVAIAGITLHEVSDVLTIVATLVSIACGSIRLIGWLHSGRLSGDEDFEL